MQEEKFLYFDIIFLFIRCIPLFLMLNPLSRCNGGVQVMLRKILSASLFLLFAFFCTTQALGQGTDLGTIRGVVTDSAGAVIPGAAVTITDTSTGAVRASTTNGQGNYEVFGLSPGTYTVTITAAGMSEMEIKDVTLHGSDVATADAQLKISQGQQTVTVSSEAVSIDTEDQTISETISSTAITELPRDSRDVYSFLYLNPNITQGSADGEFKFLGAQSYGASFSLDGQRSNGGIFGEPTQSKPSLEAVGEVNIMTSDFSAEYAGIANVRVNTKRGGSEYHGSMFYNNKNSALAAWTLDDLNGKAAFAPTAFQSKYPESLLQRKRYRRFLRRPYPETQENLVLRRIRARLRRRSRKIPIHHRRASGPLHRQLHANRRRCQASRPRRHLGPNDARRDCHRYHRRWRR